MGKTGVTTLVRPDMDLAARMTARDQVLLQRQNGTLIIKSMNAEYVGEVEPRLAQRLIKLMDGGNEYVAAISALSESDVRVFIRETFQSASQTGKLSFPPTVSESFRPYVKERLLRQDAEEETYFEESEEPDEWASGRESDEGDVTIYDFRPGTEAAPPAEDEEEE